MPYKDREKRLAYIKLYRQNHKVEISERNRKFYIKYPWRKSLENAKQRCTNPKSDRWKWYGAKGIKFNLTDQEGKILWNRDKAYLLKRPTIDRKSNYKDYTFDNCQFIEHKINSAKRTNVK